MDEHSKNDYSKDGWLMSFYSMSFHKMGEYSRGFHSMGEYSMRFHSMDGYSKGFHSMSPCATSFHSTGFEWKHGDSMRFHSVHSGSSPHWPSSNGSKSSTLSTPGLSPHCAARSPPAPRPRDARAADARPAYLAAPPRRYVDSDANTSLQNEHGHTFSRSLSDGSTFYTRPICARSLASRRCATT